MVHFLASLRRKVGRRDKQNLTHLQHMKQSLFHLRVASQLR
jgi:hypothetical protein